jgi:hypothetical protein
MTKTSLKLCGLVLLLVVTIAYKIFLPWTPWWVDLCMVLFAFILIPIQKSKIGETEKSKNDSD